jgi:hypothetical protein
MRVAKLELSGVGPFEGAVFAIPDPTKGTGELVIFEGPNGCGKTTITEALAHFAAYDELGMHEPLVDVAPPNSQFAKRFHRVLAEARIRVEHENLWLTHGFNPGFVGHREGSPPPFSAPSARRRWAAFAYKSHGETPVVSTGGTAEIQAEPLRGALSFGLTEPASAHFGQLVVNLDQEIAKAFLEAHREGASAERRRDLEHLAASRQKTLDMIANALSAALVRNVKIEVPVGQHSPRISLDGEATPIELVGEGMRSTFSWLTDLLVRLCRVLWNDERLSPLEQEFWLILDEIDESLHPTMQARLYPTLRKLFPNARIYATTHSPFVVASVGEGVVFPIRTDKDHKVRGEVRPRPLRPGESLEVVTADVFNAPARFVDAQTRQDIEAHDRDVQTLRAKRDIDWDAFMLRRDRLMELNEEVRTLVAIQEVPVQKEVLRRLRERAGPEEPEAHP